MNSISTLPNPPARFPVVNQGPDANRLAQQLSTLPAAVANIKERPVVGCGGLAVSLDKNLQQMCKDESSCEFQPPKGTPEITSCKQETRKVTRNENKHLPGGCATSKKGEAFQRKFFLYYASSLDCEEPSEKSQTPMDAVALKNHRRIRVPGYLYASRPPWRFSTSDDLDNLGVAQRNHWRAQVEDPVRRRVLFTSLIAGPEAGQLALRRCRGLRLQPCRLDCGQIEQGHPVKHFRIRLVNWGPETAYFRVEAPTVARQSGIHVAYKPGPVPAGLSRDIWISVEYPPCVSLPPASNAHCPSQFDGETVGRVTGNTVVHHLKLTTDTHIMNLPVTYTLTTSSSLRGLQHLVRSERPIFRFIWGVFVLIMLVANVGLIATLLIHYLRYNTLENIKTVRNTVVEFPDVTLCNVDPVNSDRVRCLINNTSPWCNDLRSKFSDVLEKYTLANRLFSDPEYQSVRNKLEDPSVVAIFYQLIGMEAASQIGHQAKDFIVSSFCEVTTREAGDIRRKRLCRDVGVSLVNFVTYKYFNCYTLTMTQRDVSTRAIRLSVVLYLDDEEDLACRPYCTHEFTEWAGGKVVVHPVGTYPEIEMMGMNLLPGASNQILLDESRRVQKKNMEHELCESDPEKTLSVLYFNISQQRFQARRMSYTENLCIKLLSQNATMTECQCIDFLMPIRGKDVDKVHILPFCGNLSRDSVNSSLGCSQAVRQKYSTEFIHKCPIPCLKMQYTYELTQLRWPQKPRVLKYINELKNQVYYNRKFAVYEDIEELSKVNPDKALEDLRKTDVFEKNFLQLDVNRPNFDSMMSYTENEEYTLATLLSQIGGICSIFLGFTFVTVLELLELGFQLFWVSWPSFIAWITKTRPVVRTDTLPTGNNINSVSSAVRNSAILYQNPSDGVQLDEKEPHANTFYWMANSGCPDEEAEETTDAVVGQTRGVYTHCATVDLELRSRDSNNSNTRDQQPEPDEQ